MHGRSCPPTREGYREAVKELNTALKLDKQHYWSWLERGLCHQDLGEALLAASDFSMCIGLQPGFAWGHFNRGYIFDRSGKKLEAIAAYTDALQHAPDFAPAFVNRGRHQELKDLLVSLTRSLTASIDAKDPYTMGHSERVGRIAAELGREIGMQGEELSDIYLAGLLHDIGKIGIKDSVLQKQGTLTSEEFEHIKQHPTIGFQILSEVQAIKHLLPGVLYHHERYDGRGYPHKLHGESIPLIARILAVADTLGAMHTSRPYRAAMSIHRVEEIFREGTGSQWDPQIVDALFRCKSQIYAIRQRGVGESLRHALDHVIKDGSSIGFVAAASPLAPTSTP
ncbi:MAG: rpfG 2 [Planctomycetaceae bacterium]|nr:rpfG 2 [Planctomycetaceae bacterium]